MTELQTPPAEGEEPKLTFEQALTRLEEITRTLESPSFSLEEMLKLYDEASKLIARCTSQLNDANEKITVLRGESEPQA